MISLGTAAKHVWSTKNIMLMFDSWQVMDTAKGPITIEIYKEASASVVDRFVNLW